MMTTSIRYALSVAAVACTALATSAHAAGVNRTFVSGAGLDANPCTLAQPCRTLQVAFNATAPDGEIEVLDPTGYGALTITHAVSIQGHGWASMNAAAGGTVITINAGASDHVSLRGIVIEGFGQGAFGIKLNSGGLLTVVDCFVRDFTQAGVELEPNSSFQYTIANTQLINSGTGLIVSAGSGAQTNGSVQNVIAENNIVRAIFVDSFINGGGPANMTIMLSSANLNNVGLAAQGSNVQMNVRDSNVSNNSGVGISVSLNAVVRVRHSALTGNLRSVSGAISSFGDNEIVGNGSDPGTITLISTR